MRFIAMASVPCASCEIEPKRHRAGREALDDLRRRLDFFERDGLAAGELELQQAAQGHGAAALIVDESRVFLVGPGSCRARACCSLATASGVQA